MTALRGLPSDFGYPPAREARMASEQALERAVATSCALAAALFALAFLARGLVPAAGPAAPVVRGPVDFRDFKVEPWTPPVARPAAPMRPSPGVPLPVPEATAAGIPEPDPGVTGSAGATSPDATGGLAGADATPGPVVDDTPEPGVWRSVEELPAEVSRVAPVYPDLAREAQVEGTVQLWALVDLDGSVREVRVRKSVPLLDEAAVAAVSRWRFTPALNNGRPVRVWVAIPVRFTLH